MKSSSESTPSSATSSSNKAYAWLLGISTCLSAVFCWMYVTKPVIENPSPSVPVAQPQSDLTSPSETDLGSGALSEGGTSPKQLGSQLIPSGDSLPGVKSASGAQSAKAAQSGSRKSIDPRKLVALGDGTGWETTNSRVQHILSADNGSGEFTKIVLNVPVLYQTRTMRWTPTDVEKARDVLTRLMVYENNLSKLKQEGTSLLIDWNRLLEKTVPASALRADSPSLPYNHSRQSSGSKPPVSGSTIKVE